MFVWVVLFFGVMLQILLLFEVSFCGGCVLSLFCAIVFVGLILLLVSLLLWLMFSACSLDVFHCYLLM